MEFYQRLKELRQNAGYTQEELAKKLELSSGAIGLYEQNRRTPNDSTLKKMATLFKVSIDYLLGFDDFITTSDKVSADDISFAMLDGFNSLDENDKKLVMNIIKDLQNRNK